MKSHGIIRDYSAAVWSVADMEAEELNLLQNTLADLRERADGLRRYL